MPTNYQLNPSSNIAKPSFFASVKRFAPFLIGEKKNIAITLVAVILSSIASLLTPMLVSHIIDTAIATHDFMGILLFSGILFVIFLIGAAAGYIQTKSMGGVGRRVLYNMRNALFTKLQSLPVAFFHQNRSGDLISRINNDTDKLNQFISQGLIQFVGNVFLMAGIAVCMLVLSFELGMASLMPAVGVVILTAIFSPWVKRKNTESLQSLGNMSADIQESLSNFKVVVAANRLDYFRAKFQISNEKNYHASVGSGIASTIFVAIYGFASNIAQLIALGFGIFLIQKGSLTIGLLIGFQLYVTNFYNPLRQVASMWASFQLALASLDRISEVLSLDSDMQLMEGSQGPKNPLEPEKGILTFENVSFQYPDGKTVLSGVHFCLERGKTYALVGPTGGGKTTTASLMARLYDPSEGVIFLDGVDIRSYAPGERSNKIGFILQEPFLFSGTVGENIFYGNEEYTKASLETMNRVLQEAGFSDLVNRFDSGLETSVSHGGTSMSLGQRQIIAFIRAVLRKPELLILDEATANIDTITEQILENILEKLPPETTKVIIAHRLNTIKNADRIFFVNAGLITFADSMERALDMLLHNKREG